MRTLLAYLLLSTCALAQIDMSVSKTKVLAGVTGVRAVGAFIFFETEGSPTALDAAIVKIVSPAKFARVRARVKSTLDYTQLTKISENEYVLIGPGKFVIEVTTFDPALGIDDKVADVDLGQPDAPDVPDGKFDNIASRVSSWTKGLPKRKDLAACYSEAASKLVNDPSMTVNVAADNLVVCRNKVLQMDASAFKKFIEELNSDLKSRWSQSPFTKAVMAEYYLEVAKGLSYE